MSITETILKELLEVKGTVSELPTRKETKEIAREIALTAGTAAAEEAVRKHVEDCEIRRKKEEEEREKEEKERNKEIRIPKKSISWWLKMAAAVVGISSAGAGLSAALQEMAKLFQ